MTTILIILAAIVVVGVCLASSVNKEDDAHENRAGNDSNWKLHPYNYPDAAPWEIVEGDENFSMGEDLEPGGSTYELNRQICEMFESE